ncbi:MAG: hypothetical protein ABIR31_01320 [Ginsengibacter sp.]
MKFIVTIFLISLLGCSSNDNKIGRNKIIDSTSFHLNRYKPLLGKWLKVFKNGYRVLEIKDSTSVLIYNMFNKKSSDTLLGTLSIEPNTQIPYISIEFPTWRFYYRWVKDTLIQEDEMGEQERYIKKNF